VSQPELNGLLLVALQARRLPPPPTYGQRVSPDCDVAFSPTQTRGAACLSPRQFSRVFRLETGMSPAKAIRNRRLEAARSMLELGPLPSLAPVPPSKRAAIRRGKVGVRALARVCRVCGRLEAVQMPRVPARAETWPQLVPRDPRRQLAADSARSSFSRAIPPLPPAVAVFAVGLSVTQSGIKVVQNPQLSKDDRSLWVDLVIATRGCELLLAGYIVMLQDLGNAGCNALAGGNVQELVRSVSV
jgi:AraC-like DNA-binding protein